MNNTTVIDKETFPAMHFKSEQLDVSIDCGGLTYFGNVSNSAIANELNKENNHCDYSVETIYVNRSHKEITVMDRIGLAVTVEKNKTMNTVQEAGFVIRKIISLKGMSIDSAIQCINSIEYIEAKDLLIIKESLSNINVGKFGTLRIMLDYLVPVKDIEHAPGNTIYHYQGDVILSTKNSIDTDVHPFSSRFINAGVFEINKAKQNTYQYDTGNIHLKIRYINHDQHASSLFIKIAGDVKVLHPEKNTPFKIVRLSRPKKVKEDLVPETTAYIEVLTSAKSSVKKTSIKGITSTRYTLEEAKEILGICATPLEAAEFGMLSEDKKIRLAELERQINQSKLDLSAQSLENQRELDAKKHVLNMQEIEIQNLRKENERVKNQYEASQRELDIKIKALDNEKILLDIQRQNVEEIIETRAKDHKARLDAEAAERKAIFERKNMEREESTGLIKFITVVVAAVTTLFAAIMKFGK